MSPSGAPVSRKRVASSKLALGRKRISARRPDKLAGESRKNRLELPFVITRPKEPLASSLNYINAYTPTSPRTPPSTCSGRLQPGILACGVIFNRTDTCLTATS